ncbi:MAG: hypothetical protein K2J13_04240, partial [Clostridia bacterium]|nr:hypothetical protein [Clostridia bacterium]
MNYQQLIRWMISASALLFVVALVYFIILKFDLYSKFDSADKIRNFLSKYGVFEGMKFTIIQILQVTLIPLT